MLSKATAKFIKSLQLKKYRKEAQSFLVEGKKSVIELLKSDFTITHLLATSQFLTEYGQPLPRNVIETSEQELSRLGTYQSNNSALAIAKMKPNKLLKFNGAEFGLALADINDPGNLGTIVRIADWYGLHKIIASTDTVDFYNPKVIQATMGSFSRVRMYYTDLNEFLGSYPHSVFGTYTSGENIHEVPFRGGGILLIGNESTGIAKELHPHVNYRISIPRYGQAESLNAAVATAIICDNLRRSIGQL